MRNADAWRETKFLLGEGGLRISHDLGEVARGSRFIGSVVAPVYERLIRDHARGRLLDLGCGKAPLYGLYRSLVDSCVCVDWGQSLHGTSHLDLECDLNGPIPLPDGSFDTVLFTDVLEHIAEPAHFWREVGRLLAPGGKALCAVPFLYWVHEAPHDYARYTEFQLRRLSESAGLAVVSLDAYGGSPEVLLDYFAKHVEGSRALSWLHLHIARMLRALPVVRRFSMRSRARWPLGYVVVAARMAK